MKIHLNIKLVLFITTLFSLNTLFANDTIKVNLKEVVEFAIENHPKIKNASAIIQKAKASRGEIWDIPSTEFGFAWGQLNDTYRGDNQFEIVQSLGSLLTPFYKNKFIKYQIETGNYNKEIIEKEVIAEVKIAWANYMHLYSIADIYRDHELILTRLYNFAAKENGIKDATQLEIQSLKSLIIDMHQTLKKTNEELDVALRKLKWACYTNKNIFPADTNIYYIPYNNSNNSNINEISNSYTNYYNSLTNEKLAEYKIEKSKYFPEISLGYVRQKMAPLSGLNSWIVGISVPIIFYPQQSRIKQAKIDYQISQREEEFNKNEMLYKIYELEIFIEKEYRRIHTYLHAYNNSDRIIKSIYSKLNEKISILKFIQIIKNAEDVKKSNLENIYHYNLAAIEYELYN